MYRRVLISNLQAPTKENSSGGLALWETIGARNYQPVKLLVGFSVVEDKCGAGINPRASFSFSAGSATSKRFGLLLRMIDCDFSTGNRRHDAAGIPINFCGDACLAAGFLMSYRDELVFAFGCDGGVCLSRLGGQRRCLCGCVCAWRWRGAAKNNSQGSGCKCNGNETFHGIFGLGESYLKLALQAPAGFETNPRQDQYQRFQKSGRRGLC